MKEIEEPKNTFEKNHVLKKIKLFVVIVYDGQGESIANFLSQNEAAVSLTLNGTGTASAKVYDVLSIGDKRKQIVLSLVREENIERIKEYLTERFSVSRQAKGVAFSIRITSVAGVSVYKYLTNTRIVNKENKKHGKRK